MNMNVVELVNIKKYYPGVKANDGVDLTVRRGEIHGIVGENGAGKSTLMNILYGLQQPDSGEIYINGKKVSISSPKVAIQLGIGMVHQHFMLAPSLTVAQNIILGNAPQKGPFLDMKEACRRIQAIVDQYSFAVDPNAKVYQLSIGQRQRVEIVKAIYRGANILILDEPTAVLTPQEVQELAVLLRRLRDQGCSVIIITHKLKEVMTITDRVTVMRKGHVTGVLNTAETSEQNLATLMVGREIETTIHRKKIENSSIILRIDDISVVGQRGNLAVDHISLTIKAGEIVGVCGVEGNGQTELVYALTGMIPIKDGHIYVNGERVEHLSVRARRERKMSHIPEDRLKVGCAKACSIKENLILTSYYKNGLSVHGVLNRQAIVARAKAMVQKYGVKVPNVEYQLGTLSGGNMQKVVLAREIEEEPDILIAAQPTRGVDIGAIEYIRKELVQLRDSGKAILLVSAELEEIMALSDRIVVMYEGHIVGMFYPEKTSEEELGLYMTGTRKMDLDVNTL